MTAISMDDLLIALIIGGIALTLSYLKAECASHLRGRAEELRKEMRLRELHINRLRLEQNNGRAPGPIQHENRDAANATAIGAIALPP